MSTYASVLTYKYSKYVLSIKKFLFSLHTKSDWVYLTTLIKYLKVKYIVSVVYKFVSEFAMLET